MKVVGLCGGSGSGKGLVCSYFSEFGIKTIDTDDVYHNLTASMTPCLAEIKEAFGTDVISNGALDRKRLSEIVFTSSDNLLRLNAITHKHILAEVRSMLAKYQKQNIVGVIVDAPLLFESGFDKECDATLCVLASEEQRINRIISRDNITVEAARNRIKAQKTNEWLKENCDFAIYNNSSEEELKKHVHEIAKIIFDI